MLTEKFGEILNGTRPVFEGTPI